ncbi:MAG: LacI family transcriptional regulator [Caldilineae bacterium]|nr:MAG: LacI family transcriptional regulator [Caldilineae bacterium]
MILPRAKSSVTIADVAREAGVSTATVSRVINENAPVSAATAMRVRAAIERLNYRPSAAARGLASRRTHLIGLLAEEISAPFFAPILRGIEKGAREAGLGLLIHCTQGTPAANSGYRRPLGPHNTDGILVFAGGLQEEELVYLTSLEFPVVLLHRSPPDSLDIPAVTVENKRGARELVRHLIEVHGYRRIAFLRGPEGHEDSYWREQGYREALAAADIPIEPQLLAYGGFDQKIAQQAVTAWLEQGVKPDAIFAGDDEAATGTIMALQAAGLRVPEDVAVVGFDDVYLAHPLMPPLTTVHVPIEAVGREGVRELVRLIAGGEPEPLTLLPTELVIRRSCGCQEEA